MQFRFHCYRTPYSQANRPRRHTSAQPSPPLALVAPFSQA
jgi:hypothetical protein